MTYLRTKNALGSETKKKMMAGGITASLLAVTLVFSIGLYSGLFVPPENPYQPQSIPIYTINETVTTSFADFVPYAVEFTPNTPEYTIESDLSNIENLDQFPYLTQSAKDAIAANGFVTAPQEGYDQIFEILKDNYYSEIPTFITSDAVLHAFHVCYDLALREIETYSFWDLLSNLTLSLLEEAADLYTEAPNGTWKDAALRNYAYFAVAAALLDPDYVVPEEVESLVSPVLELIEEHSTMTQQWFMEYMEDFSQFVPRGHYTRSETLSRYFQVMIWYGRVQFRLSDEFAYDHTPQAILIALMLNSKIHTLGVNVTGYDVWDLIYEPTAFFVGSADDLLPTEYNQLIQSVYGNEPTWDDLEDDSALDTFIDMARDLRDPMILGSPAVDATNLTDVKGMRLMGQRFIPDSYILAQLVYNNVGTDANPRLIPKGLDVMAALGSERAWELLDDQKQFENYEEQMVMLREGIANITSPEWAQNLYYLWLYSLLPLFQEPGDGYPLFMQNQAWVDKQLHTALASWAELRHDTILYAKQSYGAYKSVPDFPAGYIEPVPRLYSRLASLSKMLLDGLGNRSLLSALMEEKLTVLHSSLLSFRDISIKQLSGTPLNATDESIILSAYQWIERVSVYPNDVPYTADTDNYMSVIADVHTDPVNQEALEVAVGDPLLIVVAMEFDGKVWLLRGGTFSYYEFTQPVSERLTDEAWREMLDNGEAPPRPEWTQSFIVEDGIDDEMLDPITLAKDEY